MTVTVLALTLMTSDVARLDVRATGVRIQPMLDVGRSRPAVSRQLVVHIEPRTTTMTVTREGPMPRAVAAAVVLLGWYGEGLPRIEVVAARPPDASPGAEAWVRFNEDGSAVPIIFVATDSHVYRDAVVED